MASSATCFFFFLAAMCSLILPMPWSSSKETERALDALFSPDEPAFMESDGPLVSILPTLRGDVPRGGLLGLVGVYFSGLPSLLRGARTLVARSPVLLGSFARAFLSPRWTAVMALRSSESGGLLGRVSPQMSTHPASSWSRLLQLVQTLP